MRFSSAWRRERSDASWALRRARERRYGACRATSANFSCATWSRWIICAAVTCCCVSTMSVSRRDSARTAIALVAYARRRVRVLVGDALELVDPLQQVGEAVGVEHHAHEVGLRGLVLPDELAREHLAVAREAQAQDDQPGARSRSRARRSASWAASRSRLCWIPARRARTSSIRPWKPSILRLSALISACSARSRARDALIWPGGPPRRGRGEHARRTRAGRARPRTCALGSTQRPATVAASGPRPACRVAGHFPRAVTGLL